MSDPVHMQVVMIIDSRRLKYKETHYISFGLFFI